jgi:predicted nucleic acid-binding protein
MYLLDSNVLIYAIQPQYSALRLWITQNDVVISDVSKVEVLGYHKLSEADKQDFSLLFDLMRSLPLAKPVIQTAVQLRQQRKMSLGDALIAATALTEGLTLATRNIADFAWITGLALFNPVDTLPSI